MFAFVLMLCGIRSQAKAIPEKFDREAFYAIIKHGDKAEIEKEIEVVTASSVSEKDAYEGFLLMRKAGLMTLPAQKLKFFKQGRIKLETAIAGNSDNAEYRFLRLIIEEHAPKITKYSADIETDKQMVIKAYKNFSPVVQHAIIDYSKNSKVLHSSDF